MALNFDQEMEKWRGPAGVVHADEGQRYDYGDNGVSVTIKIAHDYSPHFRFSFVRYDLQPNASAELFAQPAAGRVFYCLNGSATVVLDGEARPMPEGTYVHVGEGHHVAFLNDGEIEAQIFGASFPPGIETRTDLMARSGDGALRLSITPDLRRAFGLLTLEEASRIVDGRRGELIYVEPDEGISFWQAKPTAGYIQVKMAPFTHNIHHYSAATQILYPGSRVRQHAHNQLNEMFIIAKGTVRASLDGEEVICEKGSALIIGRNVMHWWANAGDTDAMNFAIIDPPGVEGALAVTGRLRTPGDTWPDDIVRNAESGKILHDRFGFVIPGGGG